jgi:hypothetical protein
MHYGSAYVAFKLAERLAVHLGLCEALDDDNGESAREPAGGTAG